jgi:hypothetical protein
MKGTEEERVGGIREKDSFQGLCDLLDKEVDVVGGRDDHDGGWTACTGLMRLGLCMWLTLGSYKSGLVHGSMYGVTRSNPIAPSRDTQTERRRVSHHRLHRRHPVRGLGGRKLRWSLAGQAPSLGAGYCGYVSRRGHGSNVPRGRC